MFKIINFDKYKNTIDIEKLIEKYNKDYNIIVTFKKDGTTELFIGNERKKLN